ncbi:MAG: TerB family tellurite resistance protein [Myxococcaceae bacterium]|nr:TerB family tellurite resistance protein [Myxococcaceae bacterium]
MALSDDDRFNLEVLKLLLHVAWVDGAVDQTEANMLLGLGRSWTVPEQALQKLLEAVKAGRRPSEPDWDLLRQRSDDVLQAARALVLADGKVEKGEIALLKNVQAALMNG